MPITQMSFDDGIFYIREEGDITRSDALDYSKHLNQILEQANEPVVIVVDAMQATQVTLDAQKVFARVTSNPLHEMAFVACSETNIIQAASIIGMMSRDNKTYVYDSLEEATERALNRVAELRAKCDV